MSTPKSTQESLSTQQYTHTHTHTHTHTNTHTTSIVAAAASKIKCSVGCSKWRSVLQWLKRYGSHTYLVWVIHIPRHSIKNRAQRCVAVIGGVCCSNVWSVLQWFQECVAVIEAVWWNIYTSNCIAAAAAASRIECSSPQHAQLGSCCSDFGVCCSDLRCVVQWCTEYGAVNTSIRCSDPVAVT